jgi:hypothetical protein
LLVWEVMDLDDLLLIEIKTTIYAVYSILTP